MPTEHRISKQPPSLTTGFPVVVVSGGPPPDRRVQRVLPSSAHVIVADFGYVHARAMGLTVNDLVGDFDSLSVEQVRDAEADGTKVHRHPTDKDATDLELALELAISLEPSEITVVCGADVGDRFDHVASQLGLFASPLFASFNLTVWIGPSFVVPVHPGKPRSLRGAIGEIVSLLAIGGVAQGVRTTGLRYPLHAEPVSPFLTRTTSNEFAAEAASISVEEGVLLAIMPDALASTGHACGALTRNADIGSGR